MATNDQMSACEIAEVMIFDCILNQAERSSLEGYLAHKWNSVDELLPDTHPHYESSPYGGITKVRKLQTLGGDPPAVKIYWGDELIESNASGQVADPDDNASWDLLVRSQRQQPRQFGNPSGNCSAFELGYQLLLPGLCRKLLGGFSWAPTTETFKAIDTCFTKDTMDGMVLWLDAMDVDADGLVDSKVEGTALPLWVDKSTPGKNAMQNVANKTPTYATKSIGSLPSVRFASAILQRRKFESDLRKRQCFYGRSRFGSWNRSHGRISRMDLDAKTPEAGSFLTRVKTTPPSCNARIGSEHRIRSTGWRNCGNHGIRS